MDKSNYKFYDMTNFVLATSNLLITDLKEWILLETTAQKKAAEKWMIQTKTIQVRLLVSNLKCSEAEQFLYSHSFPPENKILTYQYRGSILPTGTCIALCDIPEIATAGKIGQVFLPDSNMLLEDIKILHWPLKQK